MERTEPELFGAYPNLKEKVPWIPLLTNVPSGIDSVASFVGVDVSSTQESRVPGGLAGLLGSASVFRRWKGQLVIVGANAVDSELYSQ